MRQDTDPLPKYAAPMESIHCVHEALTHQGLNIPLSHLMVVSGEPFRISYNPDNPEHSPHTVFHNPLRTVCRVLGLKHQLYYDEDYQTAWNRLYQNLNEGKVALIPFDSGHPFFAASETPGQVIGQNGYTITFDKSQLSHKWLSIDGFYELGLDGYYQFLIEDRNRLPDHRETAYGVFRLARKLMHLRRKVSGGAMGTEAYFALAGHIQNSLKKEWDDAQQDFDRILKWGQIPLSQILEGKEMVIEYLQSIRNTFEDRELALFDDAILIYQQMVSLLRKLKINFQFSTNLLQTLSESETDSPSFSQSISRRFRQRRFLQSLKACQKLVLAISTIETNAIDKFTSIVRLSEKLKI